MSHNYKCHGTTTRFAALTGTGTVIGECRARHRHEEFLKFLRKNDREVPNAVKVHLIRENYANHQHPDVKSWLAKHARLHLHFTPTSNSWLNLVERWFREITDKAIRRSDFPSVPDLVSAIENYLNAHNSDPKPLVWVACAESILEKVSRGRVLSRQSLIKIESLHCPFRRSWIFPDQR
jgi:transposase